MTKIEDVTTVEDMIEEGWCDGCDQDPVLCLNAGHCIIEKETLNGQQ